MFLVTGNDRMKVLVQTRCGHTNLFQFLGVPGTDISEQETLDEWINSSKRIVVLRHPVERMHSAISLYDNSISILINHYEAQTDKQAFIATLRERNPTYTDYFVENYFNIPDKNAVREKINFLVHSHPYMHHISNYEFDYIKFENLKNYIPPHDSPIYDPKFRSGITNQTNRTYETFPENKYYTEADLTAEVDLYNNFLSNRKEISIDEWKELTT